MDDSVGTFPRGAKLSLGRVFTCRGDLAGRGRLYLVVWVLPSCCSIRPSSVGISSFCCKLCLLLRPDSPGWFATGCHCFLRTVLLAWCWLLLPRPGLLLQCHRWVWRVSLQLGSLLWFYSPTRHWAIPLAGRPLRHLALVLIILSNVRFVTSVCPFPYGCPGDENWFLMPRPKQKSLKPCLSNCRPLSVMIVLEIPNLQIIFFHTKLLILASVIIARASASTHFVK